MKIAIIGFGKMGQEIAFAAADRNHEIVCIVDPERSDYKIDSDAFRSADVAIDFSSPYAAEANVRAAIAQGVPVVSGTTGWNAYALQCDLEGKDHPGIIWSSNYSIGVNILFVVNRYLACLMQQAEGYTPSITEIHHIHKLDAPSGTAKSLAEQIKQQASSSSTIDVPIESFREGEVSGIHEVHWESEADILTLRHEAKSRKGFALGAVLAAEWLCGKRGWHQLHEVLSLPAE